MNSTWTSEILRRRAVACVGNCFRSICTVVCVLLCCCCCVAVAVLLCCCVAAALRDRCQEVVTGPAVTTNDNRVRGACYESTLCCSASWYHGELKL